MSTHDFLQEIANQVAPGSTVRDPERFSDVLLQQENEFLQQQIRELGGNPRVSGMGVGRDFLVSSNQALKNQLELLQTPLRQGGPTVAQVQQQIPEFEETAVGSRIFPGLQTDPTRLNVLQNAFTPIVGLSQQDVQSVPGPVQPFLRALQQTLSPGGLLTGVAGPAALAGRTGIGRFFADTPGRALATEFGANLGSEAAAQADAPLPVQIGAGLAGGITGAGLSNVAGAAARQGVPDAQQVRRAADRVSPVGVADAAEPDAPPVPDASGTGPVRVPNAFGGVDLVPRAEFAQAEERATDLARLAGASRVSDPLKRQLAFDVLEQDLRRRDATQAAITNLAAQVRNAQPVSNARREALRSQERSRRVGQFAGTLESGQGQQAFRQATPQLAGELPNPRFEPPTMRPDDLFLLTERIRNLDVRPLTKLNTNTAFTRLLQGETPRPSEVPLLERAFGREFVEAFLSGEAGRASRQNILIDILGIPKTIRSAFDLSFPFRQGLLLGPRNPREFGQAFRAMFGSFSPEQARSLNTEIFADPDIQLLREHDLFLQPIEGVTPASLTGREETFVSRYASRLPGVRISERTFGTFGNKLRHDIAKKTMNRWRAEGVDVNDPERLQSLAEFINIFTGRGSLGPAENVANWLQIGFWSPRLLVSRFQAFNMLRNPQVRREAAQNLAATFGLGMTILGAVKASGLGDVEIDPRSSDFGKVRIGRTRIDFWGGYQQIFRYMAQVATGQVKSTRTGEVFKLSDFRSNRAELVTRFARSKASPGLPTILGNELFGESFLGEELGQRPDRGRPPRVIEAPLEAAGQESVREQEAILQLSPLFAVDLVDAMEEHGIVRGTGLAIPALFGVGTQTHNEPRAGAEQGIEQERARR